MRTKVPYSESEHARRKLASAYADLAAKSHRKADREAFSRMAEAWEKTLPDAQKSLRKS